MLAVNAGIALDARTQTVYRSLWLEGLGDLPYSVLEAAFKKALRACKFWPVKVADIRECIDRTRETAVKEAADLEWQRVLELRRTRWSPDVPGGFYGGAPQLSERVQSAARAAGVFREFTSEEFENGALHTWAKKRFMESYIAWEELDREQFLLPDGELKNLLAETARAKALPPSQPVSFEELHERGLRYAAQLAAPVNATAPRKIFVRPVREKSEAELAEELRRQKAALVERGYLPADALAKGSEIPGASPAASR
jgi:hypothetical protein